MAENSAVTGPRKSCLKSPLKKKARQGEGDAEEFDDNVGLGNGGPGPDECQAGSTETEQTSAVQRGLLKFEAGLSGVTVPSSPGSSQVPQSKSLAELFEAIERVNTNVSSLRSDLTASLEGLRQEVSTMKAEMVSKEVFAKLEVRVEKLEVAGVNSPQLDWLKSQVSLLDPAQKTICVSGFGSQDVAARHAVLDEFFRQHFADVKVESIEPIFSGKAGEKKITPLNLVSFTSNRVREEVLRGHRSRNLSLKDNSGAILKFDRGKTSLQLKRNASLKKVKDLVEKDDKGKGRDVRIEWLIEGSKDRAVVLNGERVFLQRAGDMSGDFCDAFSHLSI